jgi:hypothetical protein
MKMQEIEEKELEVQQDTFQLLSEINNRMKRMNSYKHRFGTAIVHGVGYAIGFFIFAGFILGILSRVIDSVHDVPILREIIETTDLDDAFNPDQD